MSRVLRLLVVAMLVLLGVALPAAPATADDRAPRLLTAERTSPTNVPGGVPVTIAWTASDEDQPGSGISYVRFSFENRDAQGQLLAWFEVDGYDVRLPDGRLAAVRALTPWAARGDYILDKIHVQDRIGNTTTYARDGSVSATPRQSFAPPPSSLDFAALDFHVDNPLSDTAVPTVTDVAPVARTVRAGEPVILTSKPADDLSAIGALSVRYVSPGGTTEVNTTADPVLVAAGLTSAVVPLGAEGGTWRASLVQLEDRAGNRAVYWRDQPDPLFLPSGVRPHAPQPAFDFASLDIEVVPGTPDAEAPTLSAVRRDHPTVLRRGDDVALAFTTSDASALRFVQFQYLDVNSHSFLVTNQCRPERGSAVDQVVAGLDNGAVQLHAITVADDMWNIRQYRRDGSVWTQGRSAPDDLPGVDLPQFDFELVSGSATYTGRQHTRFGCPTLPKLPVTLPSAAPAGSVIDVVGDVLSPADAPLGGASVGVFAQPAGESTQLLGVLTADGAGHYAQPTVLAKDTTYRVRFLGRDGVAGAEATTSAAHLVRVGERGATPAPPQPAGTPVVSRLTASPSTSTAGAPVTVRGWTDPGRAVELWAYSSPSTTYVRVRTGVAGDDGAFVFTVRPATNTRLVARVPGVDGTGESPSLGLPVHTRISLAISLPTSTGVRTFSGSTSPLVPGQPITVYRRTSAGTAVVGRTRTTADGRYVLRLPTPLGPAIYDAVVAATSRNLAGRSAPLARLR